MREYIEKILKKESKPVSLDKLFSRVEDLLSKENESEVKLTEEQKNEILAILDKGLAKYDYYKTPNGSYKLMSKTSFRKGIVHICANGDAIVSVRTTYIDKEGNVVTNKEKYTVDKSRINNAVEGDIVLMDKGDKANPASIKTVISRDVSNVYGEVYVIAGSKFVRSIDKNFKDLTVALPDDANVVEGQRVAVKLLEETGPNFYKGEITRVFNHKDDPDEEILWEAFKHGIDDTFSDESVVQISHTPTSVRDIDKIGRSDFTEWEIFTIDGADTKDIDDALSCSINEKGNIVLGVHIACPEDYVPINSPLDKDAYRKATSNYLANTVIPMFPHELSNGICSLNPGVERLALSCIMEFDKDGNVVSSYITPSVIKSRLKMTYKAVNDILKEDKIDPAYEEHVDTLKRLQTLALKLRRNRIKNGSVEFNRPELKLITDENKQVIGFSKRYQDVGENLIEECMLIANETVDKALSEKGIPVPHRIHDVPDVERLKSFLQFLDAIGYSFGNYSAEEVSESKSKLQALSKHIQNAGKLSNLLSIKLVRCMSKAKYSPFNIGHYGLGKPNYCHFTSPIRRYPDLMVHRIVNECLLEKDEKKRNKNINKWKLYLPEACEHASKMEKTADKAEEEVLKLKCCDYMQHHIGEEFDCTITDIHSEFMGIELDNLVEGEIRLSDLPGDYVGSHETYSAISMDGRESFYIGDRLRVKVKSADKDTKRIYFDIVSKIDTNVIKSSEDQKEVVKMKIRNDRAKRVN